MPGSDPRFHHWAHLPQQVLWSGCRGRGQWFGQPRDKKHYRGDFNTVFSFLMAGLQKRRSQSFLRCSLQKEGKQWRVMVQ